MKKNAVLLILCLICGLFISACGSGEENDMSLLKKEFVVGKDISKGDITDFYYTYSNINYNAFYQRYRFYIENGKKYFFHETRERQNEYGPATEDDTTKIGTVELTEEQWKDFYDLINGGTVKKREESAESGDSGPWFYLYWKDDKSKYQEYSFPSYEAQKKFEEYCSGLADESAEVSAEKYPPIDETVCGSWQGFFYDVSGDYHMTIENPADGRFPVTINFSWMYSDSGGGMYTYLVDVTGTAYTDEDGVTILEGDLDDGSSAADQKIKAILTKNNDRITMIILESSNSRLTAGSKLDYTRE